MAWIKTKHAHKNMKILYTHSYIQMDSSDRRVYFVTRSISLLERVITETEFVMVIVHDLEMFPSTKCVILSNDCWFLRHKKDIIHILWLFQVNACFTEWNSFIDFVFRLPKCSYNVAISDEYECHVPFEWCKFPKQDDWFGYI